MLMMQDRRSQYAIHVLFYATLSCCVHAYFAHWHNLHTEGVFVVVCGGVDVVRHQLLVSPAGRRGNRWYNRAVHVSTSNRMVLRKQGEEMEHKQSGSQ